MSKPTPKRIKRSKLNPGEDGTLTYLGELGFGYTTDQETYLLASDRPKEKVAIYHHKQGTLNPDFTLFEQGKEVGVIEVEDIAYRPEDAKPTDKVVAGVPGFERAQRKIKDAAIQLTGAHDLPTLAIVRDAARTVPADPLLLMALVFGWPQLVLGVGPNWSKEPQTVFGKGGKFADPSEQDRNSHVSAFAWYRKLDVTFERHGIRQACEEAASSAPIGSTVGQVLERMRPVEEAASRMGLKEDHRHSLLIILNPWAKIQWPETLWGPYDQVYRVNPDTRVPELVHDGLAVADQIEVPKSATQSEFDSLLDDPNLRND